MKKLFKLILLSLAVVALITFALASTALAGGPRNGTCQGNWSSNSSFTYTQGAPLTEKEVYWLTFMREEEKLARDVYRTLYDRYHVRVFKNIAASEQKHMDAVESLLIKYGIPDPVANEDTLGGFTFDELKTLYTELITSGISSLPAAYQVGVDIENVDIEDLLDALKNTSNTHVDIERVYNNLLQGSYNHLAAFSSHVE